MIYLDNAATSFPKPKSVLNAMCRASLYSANPGRGGHRLSAQAGEIVFKTREKAAELFHADIERVIFTKNCTESLNTMIKGCLTRGDHVIISSLEHNSLLRPVQKLSEQGIITYDVANVIPQSDEQTVSNFRSLIRPNTKLIACCHVSNVFGTVLPIKKISELCRENGILFAVDAAQSAGTFGYDMNDGSIDFLCMPGHKGLLGPMGTGLLILNHNAQLDSFIEGGTGSLSLERSQPEILPDKFESGTVNLPGIAGLYEGLKIIEATGCEKISDKENRMTEFLTSELKNIGGVTVYDNMHSKTLSGVLSFNIGNAHSEQIGDKLDKMQIACRAGYHCSALAHTSALTDKQGTVRVSPGYFNNMQDIKKLVYCIKKIAKEL
ncbi:MAG: aminotransferase class V-fold PLP-dependent enzyme [Acutalibacteraceae bacterium]